MDIYSFTYRGILTGESLRKLQNTQGKLAKDDKKTFSTALSFEMLDEECLKDADRMSLVYVAMHSIENMIRKFVQKVLFQKYQDKWWDKAPDKVKQKTKTRREDDEKTKWHGSRGASDIQYCDFGDLSSIMVVNWNDFTDIITDMEWMKSILSSLERSRNITMHGGNLSRQDIDRIGVLIRDWCRQVG